MATELIDAIKEIVVDCCEENEFNENIFKLWFQWYYTNIDDPYYIYSGDLYVSYLSFHAGVNSTHKLEGRP
jgi:hypothetical protein